MKKIVLISNDKLYFNRAVVSSDFNDTINIIESLSKESKLYFFSRKNKTKGSFKTFLNKNVKLKLSKVFSLNLKNKIVFMISITPFNFMVYFFIKLINKKLKGFVILRSDGHKEYFIKYGFFGKIFYHFFFDRILKDLKPIIVSKNLSNVEKHQSLRVYPSEIDDLWKKNLKKADISKPRLLYIGRIKKEKGVFSLLKLINELSIDFNLSILGVKNNNKSNNIKIKYYKETSKKEKIIEHFDKNNIFILPSFTEGYPKVLLESLSRNRPVIVFKEISHVKTNFKGIFVSERNSKSLQKNILYILSNYKKIQKKMKKNKIPTKLKFQNDLREFIK